MVAQTINLPNIRKIFIPDPGMLLCEVDLSGAEAQVVAWEAGDENLKDAFKAKINVHIKNARDVFHEKLKTWTDEEIHKESHPGGVYYIAKRCVHATHNGGAPQGLANQITGLSISQAREFQKTWFKLHPKIKQHQNYILECLIGRVEGVPRKTITNRFGYRIVFFDKLDSIFTEALTWVQQSTVGCCAFKGAIALDKIPWVQLLLQVHDSLVFQIPKEKENELHLIKATLHKIIIPYGDPLCIPWTLKMSDKSWGDAKDIDW